MAPKTLLAPFALVLAIALGPVALLAGAGQSLATWAQFLVAALGVFALWSGLASDGS